MLIYWSLPKWACRQFDHNVDGGAHLVFEAVV